MTPKTVGAHAIHRVLPWKATVGESPVWSEGEQKLYWIDIQQKEVHQYDPTSGLNRTFTLPEIVTSIALRASGGLVLTLKDTFAAFEPVTGALQRIGAPKCDVANLRFNDGKCDPRGRFFSGTMDEKRWSAPTGTLFRMNADHSIAAVRSDVVCSNGCGWSPDGRTMYHTESFRYAVFAYDFEPEIGTLSNRRPFMTLPAEGGGFPDGLAVDSEGFVWSNVVGLGQIHRCDPRGNVERILQLPVPRATACTFGGPGLRTLYITSARETMTPAQLALAPFSGSVFAYESDVPGLGASLFAG